MVKEFKAFAMKGNILELATAFILGVAFAAVVNSLVDDVIMNLIAAIVGEPDFTGLTWTVGDGVIRYGSFLTVLASFLLVAFAMFMIVKAVSRAMHPGGHTPEAPTLRDCPYCLSEVPVRARRCSHCTSKLPQTEDEALAA